MTSLTAKQRRFVEEYLIDLNATQAAIRAGYSRATATEMGWENLRKPQVAEAISKAQLARSARTGVEADRVVRELARIAFASLTDVATWLTDPETGQVKVTIVDSDLLGSETAPAIAEIGVGRDGVRARIKMHDKLDALEKLGRHLGLFKERVELTGASVIIDIGSDQGSARELLVDKLAHREVE